MRCKSALLKYVVPTILLLGCFLQFHHLWFSSERTLKMARELASDLRNATVQGGWFPNLSSRIKYGTPYTWLNPAESESNPADYTGVIDPIAEETFLALKTGAEVLWDRVPIHMETTFKRFPHHKIYADTDTQVGDERVTDILAGLSPTLISDTQLGPYRLRRSEREESWGWDTNDFRQESSHGWDIDKFKNIPMMYNAYMVAPKHCKWFLFIDDDTYIHSQSLGALLRQLDSSKPHYIGSLAMLPGRLGETGKVGQKLKKQNPDSSIHLDFAHGGSGIIVSREALEQVFWDAQRHQDIVQKYSKIALHICCGDALMAYLFREEIELYVNSDVNPDELSVDPFQGEALENTEIGTGERAWCSRIITWHHMSPWEIQTIYDWETSLQTRKANLWPGVLYSDYYHDFILPYATPRREYWDNLAKTEVYSSLGTIRRYDGEVEKFEANKEDPDTEAAYYSDENCQRECQDIEWCLGWRFEIKEDETTCSLEFDNIRRGMAVLPFRTTADPNKNVISGWNVDRIREIRSSQPCDTLVWQDETNDYSAQPMEREGWYFSELDAERGGIHGQPILTAPAT